MAATSRPQYFVGLRRPLLCITLVFAVLATALAQRSAWPSANVSGCAGVQNLGPFKIECGSCNTGGIGLTVSGAVARIATSYMGDVAFVGTVNGGVWKTDNLHRTNGADIHWVFVLAISSNPYIS